MSSSFLRYLGGGRRRTGFCYNYDWDSEELRPFAETCPNSFKSGTSLAGERVKQYFQGAARRNAGSEREE